MCGSDAVPPDAPPALATARLVLEPLTDDPALAREMVQVLSDPALYAHTGGTPPEEAELVRRYARQSRGASPDGSETWLNWVVREAGSHAALGYVQATIDRHTGAADMAWVTGAPFQRRGYAAEAAAAVLQWLHSREDVLRVTAHIGAANAASEAVARRLGLAPTPEVERGEVVWALPEP